jgi:hypothetical protein
MKKKILSYLGIIVVTAISICLCGCEKEEADNSISGHKYSEADIKRALDISNKLNEMRRDTNEDASLNTQIYVLNQPTFPGAVGKEGAIVNFDANDNPVRGITTRTFERETGVRFDVRELTSAELAEASEALKKHYYSTMSAEDRRDIKTVVIFSESYKMAVCESVLNLRKDRNYYMLADRSAKTAGIYIEVAGVKTLIAEDKIYYSASH